MKKNIVKGRNQVRHDYSGFERDYFETNIPVLQLSKKYGICYTSLFRHIKMNALVRDSKKERSVHKRAIDAQRKHFEHEKSIAKKDMISLLNKQTQALIDEEIEINSLIKLINAVVNKLSLTEIDIEIESRVIKNIVDASTKTINLRRRLLAISDNANGDANQPEHVIHRIELVPMVPAIERGVTIDSFG